MATPSSAPRQHATSTPTPKGNPGSTPSTTNLTSPAAVAMARQFSASHRSPSTKNTSHSHNLSTSSHPSSTPIGATATPLGALALGEDGNSLNSPAMALMAGLGGQEIGLTPGVGLTPFGLRGGADGLGISNGPEMQMNGTGTDSNAGIRNPGAERDKRLVDAIAQLKTRVAGRGVCREGVERLAQLAGFTFLWQDDTLTIAGNSVDLEVDFFPGSDSVRDASLKIAINAEAEAEGKEEASRVLQQDLMEDDGLGGWKRMDGFASNLDRLGRLDHLSQGVNCFEAEEGLYESFQKIWTEEKKRFSSLGPIARLSRGGIGRPTMHKARRLGIGVEYWAPRQAFVEQPRPSPEADNMVVDAEETTLVNKEQTTLWAGRVECETGYPSLRVSKDWFSVDALHNAEGEELGSALSGAWLDPPATLATRTGQEHGNEGDTGNIFVPGPPNVRFVFELEPAVVLPLGVISTAFIAANISMATDATKMKGVHDYVRQLLQQPKGIIEGESNVQATPQTTLRWKRTTATVSADGRWADTTYDMSFRTGGQIWCYSVESFPFEHPRQIASLLPVLRQYALLWTLMKNAATAHGSERPVRVESQVATVSNGEGVKDPRAPKKRSNINPRRARLAALLKDKEEIHESPSIEMTLRLMLGAQPQPVLDISFPLQRDVPQIKVDTAAFGYVSIDIGQNGQLAVGKAENIPFAQSEDGREKIAKVLRLSEDISILVAWIQGYSEKSQ